MSQWTFPGTVYATEIDTPQVNSAGNIALTNTSTGVSTTLVGQSTRTITFPDVDDTLVGRNEIVEFRGKTISSAYNSVDATSLQTVPIGTLTTFGDSLLRRVGGTIRPSTISASGPLILTTTLSSLALSLPVGSSAGSVAAGDDPRISSAAVFSVKPAAEPIGYHEYHSIFAAVAAANAAVLAGQFHAMVIVYPGEYTESQIISLSNVSVIAYPHAHVSGMSPVFELFDNSAIEGLGVIGQPRFGAIAVRVSNSTAGYARIRDCAISGSAGSECTSTLISITAGADCTIEGVNIDGICITGLLNNGSVNSDQLVVTASCGWGIRNFGDALYSDIYSETTTNGFVGSNIGVLINSGNVSLSGARIIGTLQIDSASQRATISGDVGNLIVSNYLAQGNFNGRAGSYTNNSMTFTIVGTHEGVIELAGSLTYATPVAATSGYTPAEIGELTIAGASLGCIRGGSVRQVGGTTVVVNGGVGYITENLADHIENLRKVTWADTEIGLKPGVYYIYVDSNGTVVADASLPSYDIAIVLARIGATASEIEFVDPQYNSANHASNHARDMFRELSRGGLFASGCTVESSRPYMLDVSNGKYYWLDNEIRTVGGTQIKFIKYYHRSGEWTQEVVDTLDPSQFDDGSDLNSVPSTWYTKGTLYLVGGDSLVNGSTTALLESEKYLYVVAQTCWETQFLAESAPLAVPPSYFVEGITAIAGIVMQSTAPDIVNILDCRPMLIGGQSAGHASGVSRHSDLTGLLADDHQQYLLANGTRPMSGDLSMGSHAITGTTTVNGVVVNSHGSRHLPAGADPLTTAAAVGLSSATTNAVGTANSFARSDHTHAINITGFNRNNLTGVLSVANGGTGAATLTTNGVLVGAGTSAVTTTKAAPTGVFVGTTDVQTLTGKTITDVSNTVSASLIRGVTVNATAPVAGQALVATSGTAASWSSISDSLISGTVSVAHGGTGVSTLTTGGVLVGGTTVTSTKLAPAGDFVGTTDTQTLTGKTISALSNTITGLNHTALSNIGTNTHAQIDAHVAATIAHGTVGAIVGTTDVQTLTNKTISGAANTITGVDHTTLTNAGTNTHTQIDTHISAVDAHGATGAVVGTTNAQTLTSKTLTSPIINGGVETGTIYMSTGSTFGALLDTSANTTTRTVTMPDASGTLLLSGAAQSMSNKTITSSTFTGVSTGSTYSNSGFGFAVDTTALTSTRTITYPNASGAIVLDSNPQTVTNKIISGLTNTITGIDHTTLSNIGTNTHAQIDSHIAATTAHGITGAIVGTTDSQTLTNKTISAASNTITGINHTALSNIGTNTHAQIDAHITATTAHGIAGSVVGTTDAQTLTNKTISGAVYTSTGASFGATINTSGLTASRALVIPNAAGTIVLDTATQTLTNKTISGSLNTITGIDHTTLTNAGTTTHAQIDSHIAATTAHGITGAVVGTTDSQTLTNKTISGAVYTSTGASFGATINTSGLTASRVLVIPNTTGTVVLDGAIQSLTGKTIDAALNTLTNIDHTTLLNRGTNTHAQIDSHIAAAIAHGVSSPLVSVADTQTIANKAFSSCTYLNPVNNTFTPATYLVRDSGAGVQSIGRVDGIASTMLSDSGNIVRPLTSPTFTTVTTTGNATVGQDLTVGQFLTVAQGHITVNNQTIFGVDQAQVDFQIDNVSKFAISTSNTAPYDSYIQAVGSLSLSAGNGTSYLTLPSTGIALNSAAGRVLVTDGGPTLSYRTDFVSTAGIQTLTGKTLVTPVINTSFDLVSTNKYTITPVNPAANRIYSLQDTGASSNICLTDGVYYNATTNQGVPPTIGYKVKTWRGTSTTTSGVAVFNVTTDGLASPGFAIFSNLSACTIIATARNNTASAIAVPLCAVKVISTAFLTVNVVNGVTAVLASNTLAFAPNGTVVNVLVIGV